MNTIRLVVVCASFFVLSAYADQAFETIEHSCNAEKKQYQLYYQIFWNTPAPSGSDFTSVPGKKTKHKCILNGTPITAEVVLYEPRAQGMGGGVPGGIVLSLKYGEMEILKEVPVNSNDFSRLERVVLKQLKDGIEITFCGSHWRKETGEKPGCFVERHKNAQLPRELYTRANFPFSKYDPNSRLETDGYLPQ